MSKKMPFTLTVTRNETGETETYDTNVVMAGISVDDGTQMVCMIKNASPFDIAGALFALRGIEKIELQEHPEFAGLIEYVEASQKSDADV